MRKAIHQDAPMSLWKVSSSAECRSTHCSSVIVFRQAIVGAPSGPTGCRNCQLLLCAISRIFSATSLGGTGAFVRTELNSRHAGRVRIDGALGVPDPLRHRSVKIPGSTIATRTPKVSSRRPNLRSAPPTPISKRNRGLRVAG